MARHVVRPEEHVTETLVRYRANSSRHRPTGGIRWPSFVCLVAGIRRDASGKIV